MNEQKVDQLINLYEREYEKVNNLNTILHASVIGVGGLFLVIWADFFFRVFEKFTFLEPITKSYTPLANMALAIIVILPFITFAYRKLINFVDFRQYSRKTQALFEMIQLLQTTKNLRKFRVKDKKEIKKLLQLIHEIHYKQKTITEKEYEEFIKHSFNIVRSITTPTK